MTTHASEAEARKWLKNLAGESDGQVSTPKPKRATRKRLAREPKPIEYRPGVYKGRKHLWGRAWDGWEQKCNGLGRNGPEPDWSGKGEECPRCYQEEVEGG